MLTILDRAKFLYRCTYDSELLNKGNGASLSGLDFKIIDLNYNLAI